MASLCCTEEWEYSQESGIIHLYSPKLIQATVDPVRLAIAMYSQGIITYRSRNFLLVPSSQHDKAVILWYRIETHIFRHQNPRQALINVSNVMKQLPELESLANVMVTQVVPIGKNP